MTNGQKLQMIVPNLEYEILSDTVLVTNNNNGTWFSLDWWNAEDKEPTIKNDLGVDPIDRVELLKAMDTWDKFGYSTRYGLERLDKDDKNFVPYVKYDDMLKCVKGMSSVTPQPKTGHWIEHEHNGKSYIECSECLCWFLREHLLRNSYCPNCSADMREVEE